MLAEGFWDVRIIGTVMALGIPLAAIIGGIWYKTTKATSENELKRTLAERGMSAEDIERVMRAGKVESDDD